MIKKSIHTWLPLALLLGLLVLFFVFRLDSYLSFSSLREHRELLIGWSQSHYFSSALLFIICYTLAVAISIPGAVFFTLVGGFLFGVFGGTVLVVFSATLGSTLIFFAVRTSLGSWLAQSAKSWLKRMREGFQQNAFSYLLFLRLVPLFPFWIVNIVPALLGVELKTYIIATFLGIIPGSFVYVLAGDSLSQVFAANKTPDLDIIFAPQVLLSLFAIAGLSLIPLFYKLLKRKSSKATNVNLVNCDIAIIGAGAGGLSVAAVASQLGLKVVLIESGKMGGDCLNYGCIPSKSLLAAAKMAYQTRHDTAQFGINVKDVEIDFNKVMQHVHQVINTIKKQDSIKRFESLGVQVIQASAHFSDTKTLIAGKKKIQARQFIIATGSSPFCPPIPGLKDVSYLTNETIFDLREQPKHLIVIGGGPIGCELAQAFAMLGSKVTIVEGLSLLNKDDADCVSILREQLQSMGVIIYEQSQVQHIKYDRNKNSKVAVEQQGKHFTLTGSHLLLATGRRPNVAKLELEKANIHYSAKGITVNAHLQTSNKRVYALGDVIGHYQFTHIASYHASIILRNVAFKLSSSINYQAIPWVTYTDPEIAHVGILTEEALKDSTMQITEWPLSENDRAQTDRSLTGKIKVITNKKGKILGATIISKHAGELILPWVIAIRERKTLRQFTDVIVPYPTLSEISKRVAGEFYQSTLFSNKTRWLVGWLKKLG